jgi:hypothetical protein
MHLLEEISCLISAEITLTIMQMPFSEMAHQISVVGVILKTPAVRFPWLSITLKTAQRLMCRSNVLFSCAESPVSLRKGSSRCCWGVFHHDIFLHVVHRLGAPPARRATFEDIAVDTHRFHRLIPASPLRLNRVGRRPRHQLLVKSDQFWRHSVLVLKHLLGLVIGDGSASKLLLNIDDSLLIIEFSPDARAQGVQEALSCIRHGFLESL